MLSSSDSIFSVTEAHPAMLKSASMSLSLIAELTAPSSSSSSGTTSPDHRQSANPELAKSQSNDPQQRQRRKRPRQPAEEDQERPDGGGVSSGWVQAMLVAIREGYDAKSRQHEVDRQLRETTETGGNHGARSTAAASAIHSSSSSGGARSLPRPSSPFAMLLAQPAFLQRVTRPLSELAQRIAATVVARYEQDSNIDQATFTPSQRRRPPPRCHVEFLHPRTNWFLAEVVVYDAATFQRSQETAWLPEVGGVSPSTERARRAWERQLRTLCQQSETEAVLHSASFLGEEEGSLLSMDQAVSFSQRWEQQYRLQLAKFDNNGNDDNEMDADEMAADVEQTTGALFPESWFLVPSTTTTMTEVHSRVERTMDNWFDDDNDGEEPTASHSVTASSHSDPTSSSSSLRSGSSSSGGVSTAAVVGRQLSLSQGMVPLHRIGDAVGLSTSMTHRKPSWVQWQQAAAATATNPASSAGRRRGWGDGAVNPHIHSSSSSATLPRCQAIAVYYVTPNGVLIRGDWPSSSLSSSFPPRKEGHRGATNEQEKTTFGAVVAAAAAEGAGDDGGRGRTLRASGEESEDNTQQQRGAPENVFMVAHCPADGFLRSLLRLP